MLTMYISILSISVIPGVQNTVFVSIIVEGPTALQVSLNIFLRNVGELLESIN